MWKEVTINPEEVREFVTEHKRKTRFLIDESLGIEAARVIIEMGWNAIYVGDVGLGGRSDEDVMAYAWRQDRILLTHDDDFLDDRRFPPHRNPGVIVLPGAEGTSGTLERELARVLVTIGNHRTAYRGCKIHIREDGTWVIRHRNSPRGVKNAELLRFGSDGKIFEWRERG